MDKKRILFVDDEQEILDGLSRILRPMRSSWEMEYVTGGKAALEVLSRGDIDVIISDMCMPGMSGSELLRIVKDKYPDIIRVVLSGRSDQAMLRDALDIAHQYLSKPCEPDRLISTVSNACGLRDWIMTNRLRQAVIKLESLPSHPGLHTKFNNELQLPDPSVKRIGEIFARDMSLTLKALQIINSGFFPPSKPILDPAIACEIIGLDTLRQLAVSPVLSSAFDRNEIDRADLSGLWDHSFRVGKIAVAIAETEGLEAVALTSIYLAGFLHDVGKIVLLKSFPEDFTTMLSLARDYRFTQLHIERQVFGCPHTDVGGYLLALWGLPRSVVTPVICHHTPERCQDSEQFIPTAIVYASNRIEHALDTEDWMKLESSLNNEYMERLELTSRIPVWCEAARSVINQRGDHQ